MTTSGITSTVYIVAGEPATFDKSGYETLFTATPTQVKGISMFGGGRHDQSYIDVPDLETGFTKSVKGARKGATISVAHREIIDDAGQAIVEASSNTFTNYSVMLLLPATSGKVRYYTGLIDVPEDNDFSTENYLGTNWTLTLNFDMVPADAPS